MLVFLNEKKKNQYLFFKCMPQRNISTTITCSWHYKSPTPTPQQILLWQSCSDSSNNNNNNNNNRSNIKLSRSGGGEALVWKEPPLVPVPHRGADEEEQHPHGEWVTAELRSAGAGSSHRPSDCARGWLGWGGSCMQITKYYDRGSAMLNETTMRAVVVIILWFILSLWDTEGNVNCWPLFVRRSSGSENIFILTFSLKPPF